MNKYRYISCAVFLILDILSTWLCSRFENGYLAILTTMLGIAYLVWEISQTQVDHIKIGSVVFTAISITCTAIIGYYAKFGTGLNRTLVPIQLLFGFTIPSIFLAAFLGYVAISRSNQIKLRLAIPCSVWPIPLISLPAYLFSAWEISGYSAPFKCSAIAVVISIIISFCSFLVSLKQSNTTYWLATISAFIFGIFNIFVLLYTILSSPNLIFVLEFLNKLPKNAAIYCFVAGAILIISTILHTFVYLKNGVSKKTAICIIASIIIIIIGTVYIYYSRSTTKIEANELAEQFKQNPQSTYDSLREKKAITISGKIKSLNKSLFLKKPFIEFETNNNEKLKVYVNEEDYQRLRANESTSVECGSVYKGITGTINGKECHIVSK